MVSEEATTWAAQLWCLPENEKRQMDAEFAMSIAQKVDGLISALDGCLDALIWTSGSSDFGVDGQAYKGWLKLGRPSIEKAQTELSGVRSD